MRTERKYLQACLLHNTVISLVSVYHHHSLARYLVIHQDNWFGQKYVLPFRKTFDRAGFYTFEDKKYTKLFCCN